MSQSCVRRGPRARVFVPAVVLCLAGCASFPDNDLPRDDGRVWACEGHITPCLADGILFGTSFACDFEQIDYPPETMTVCANADVEATEVAALCERQGRAAWDRLFPGRDPDVDFTARVFPDLNCDFYYIRDSAREIGLEPDDRVVPMTASLARYALTLSGDTNTIAVSSKGAGGSSSLSGRLAITLEEDGAGCVGGCPLTLNGLEVSVEDFAMRGCGPFGVRCQSGDIGSATLMLAGRVPATWMPDTSFRIESGQLFVQLNFTVDGEPASTVVPNQDPIVGNFDPIAGTFSFGGRFEDENVQVNGSIRAQVTGRPPVAVIAAEAPVECQADGTAPVTVRSLSSDVDGDLHSILWSVAGIAYARGAELTVPLPLGVHPVELHVHDRRGAGASTSQFIEVVDTMPPVFGGPGTYGVDSCGTLSVLDAVEADAADSCDGQPVTTLTVVAVNGSPTNIPWGPSVNDLEGELTVHARALDASGNAAEATFFVLRDAGSACCSGQADVLLGTDTSDAINGGNQSQCVASLAGDDTISSGNSGDTVFAGAGRDTVFGGNSADLIDGGVGNDAVHGGNGDDELSGGPGVDTIFGENGSDRIRGGAGADQIFGGNGADSFYINGPCEAALGERIDGGSGHDTVYSPLTRDQLQSLGVQLISIETITVVAIVASEECR